MLGRVWLATLLISIFSALGATSLGDAAAPQRMVQALFESCAHSITVAITLAGTLALWMGLFALAEAAGITQVLARALSPLLCRLLPQVPAQHPALGFVSLNMAANMLGLDNAATPAGIKAMQSLQTLNPEPDRLSHAQATFLVLNAGSITLLPVSVMMYRAQAGSTDPAIVFLPLLLVSIGASLVGLVAALLCQGMRVWQQGWFWALLMGLLGVGMGVAWVTHGLTSAQLAQFSSILGNGALLLAIAGVAAAAWRARVDALPVFVAGCKEGLHTTFTITPYLVAMLAAVALLRASGVLDVAIGAIGYVFQTMGVSTTGWLDALPTGLMKTFSGSAARALMLDQFAQHGPDSLSGRIASLFQGASETTFYVLSIYAGSVGISRVRYALGCALLADAASVLLAIALGLVFFA